MQPAGRTNHNQIQIIPTEQIPIVRVPIDTQLVFEWRSTCDGHYPGGRMRFDRGPVGATYVSIPNNAHPHRLK
jgi:hypothetical protein